jgi:hypothetical protein
METRAEAVEYLQGKGFFAMERTWTMGDTVLVMSDPTRFEEDGTPFAFNEAAYIYPWEGAWAVDDMLGHCPSDPRRVSLREACDIVIEVLQREPPSSGVLQRLKEWREAHPEVYKDYDN